MNIVIFGQRSSSPELGHFAKAIVKASQSYKNVTMPEPTSNLVPDVILYASRSDHQLPEAVALAKKHGIPLVVVSTDIKEQLQAISGGVAVRYYPNTSLHTITFMKDIEDFHNTHKSWSVSSFTEWHQESKKSLSGTAVAIASSIGLESKSIRMIRDNEKANKEMNIPKSADAYAVHTIVFANSTHTAERVFSLTTIGRDDYANGAVALAIKAADEQRTNQA